MEDRKIRILGQMFGQHMGKEAIVLGAVTKVGSGGKTIEMTTSDNARINVTVPEMIEAEPSDMIEVWGTVKSKGTMVATQCVLFKEENCKNFDPKAYNDMIIMQRAISDRLWKLNTSRKALH